MAWKQTRAFNLNKMGRNPGWCLQNVRLSFGITKGKYPSAKADMQSQINNKTLHHISSLPTNVAVPVYIDTVSPYEHVVVYDRGVWYSDGQKTKAPNAKYVFGWGEFCDGARVVEWVKDTKTCDEVAREVIAGVWGNGEERRKRLTKAGYNYDTIQKAVNKILSAKKSNDTIAREVIMGKWGNGSERKARLEKAGYNYNTIQSLVNKLMR